MPAGTMRYRLYREHKYLLMNFDKVLQLCGVTDFSVQEEVDVMSKSIEQLFLLLQGHADFEESRIHALLRANGSLLADKADADHAEHKVAEDLINVHFEAIRKETDKTMKHQYGYALYLNLRDFLKETLEHLSYEERIIMPELQRLCTDDELRDIDFISYKQMTPEQMVHMMEELSPVMNLSDKHVYFEDMNLCEPEKFSIAWQKLKDLVSTSEAKEIEASISISPPSRPLDPVKLKYPWE